MSSCSDDTVPATDANPRPTPIDGGIVFLDSWRGEWNATLTFRDCNSGHIVTVEDVVDRILLAVEVP